MSGDKSASVAAPDGMAQERLIRGEGSLLVGSAEGGVGCLEMVAGVSGLIRGDPIEVEALAGVLATSVGASSRDSRWWDPRRAASDILGWRRAWQVC